MKNEIEFLSEKNEFLNKENSELKLKLKKKNLAELNNKDKIIE